MSAAGPVDRDQRATAGSRQNRASDLVSTTVKANGKPDTPRSSNCQVSTASEWITLGSIVAPIQKLEHLRHNRYARRMPIRARRTVRRPAGDLTSVRRAIVACELCPRLRSYCVRVARQKKREFLDWTYWGRPVPGFGDPRARLMVVGLAPAAHGGNRTGRVFTGDSSGDWLYEALHRFGFASQPTSVSRDDGLRLRDCYVNAAARCAPPDNKPTPGELERCRAHLEAEIRLLRRVRVIVALGRVAFDSWLRASGWWVALPARRRPRFAHGAEVRLPDGRILLGSFHPSRRNTNTGLLTRPMWHDIFRRARRLVGPAPGTPIGRPRRSAGRPNGAPLAVQCHAAGERDDHGT